MIKKHLLFVGAICLHLGVNAQATFQQREPSKDYFTGVELYQEGKFNLASPYFEAFLKSESQKNEGKSSILAGDAAYYLAVCSKETSQDIAEQQLLNYLEQYPGHPKVYAAYYHLGDYYFDRSNYQDAITYFEKTQLSALNATEQEDYKFKYAFCFFSMKKFKEAYNQFQEQAQNPSSDYYHEASYYSGLSAYYLKDYPEALKMFRNVESTGKYKNVVPYYITSILFISGNYQEVISYAEPLLQNKQIRNVTEMQHLVGNAAFELKDYQKAAPILSEYVTKAAKVSQEDYYQLGYVYYQTGQYAKSVENFKKLSFLDNAMVQNAMFTMGKAYNALGDKANAKSSFQQAARMKYDAAIAEESAFNICKINYELTNYSEAMTSLRKFLSDYPNSKYKAEAQELMAEVFLKTRNYDEALAYIEKMPDKSANIKAAYQKMAYYRATELFNNKDYKRANELFDKSLLYTSDKSIEALAYYWKADIAHQNGDYEGSNNLLTRFLSQAATVSNEHSSKVSAATAYYMQGYNNFKLKQYQAAQIAFSKSLDRLKLEKDPVLRETVYPDALMRLADCYYIRKEFKEAGNYYNIVIKENLKGVDYAMYQKAILDGLSGKDSDKTDALKKIYKSYPSSPFADDALYELGNTYMFNNQPYEAMSAFNTLTQSYSKSEWVPYAYNNIGLIQYNQNQLREALNSYKTVIQKFPKTPASQNALIAIKDIYINLGEPNEYFNLLKQYPGAMVSTSAQDSIVYQSAESQFSKGDYDKALKGFDQYLKEYPQGAYLLEASYYRGECYNLTAKEDLAVADYERVISLPVNRFTERSLLRAASIRYKLKQWDKALNHYNALLESAQSEENLRTAQTGIMKCKFKLKQFAGALEAAEKFIQLKGLPEMEMLEALYIKGVSNYELGALDKAYTDLESITKKINNEWAAEAKYLMVKIRYLQKKYKEAEDQAFEFMDMYPSYAQWMAKNYILLSDIYLAQNQLFQAKATLESLLDNYDKKDELYNEASEKLKKIIELESKESKVKAPVNGAGFSDFEK